MLTVLRHGMTLATRQHSVAFPLYVTTLLLTLAPTSVAALALGLAVGNRTWGASLLGPDWANQLVEVAAAALAERAVGDPAAGGQMSAAGSSAVMALMLSGLALLLQGVLYNLLAGGILERARGGRSVPFWPGCRRWFLAFVRLGSVGMVLFGLLLLGGLSLLASLELEIAPTLVLFGGFVWISVLNGWLELARANMVASDDRRALHAVDRATRLVFQRGSWPRALGVWLILGLIGASVLMFQLSALTLIDSGERPSLMALLATLVVGQGLVYLGAWFKVARLATALALDESLASSASTT